MLAAAFRAVGGLKLHFTTLEAGALVYRERGVALAEAPLEAAAAADAVLLGAMGLPEVRYPDGRAISPQVDLRQLWGLFDGARPLRALTCPHLPLSAPRPGGPAYVTVPARTQSPY